MATDRGAVVKAMAICTRHSFLHIYKVIVSLPLFLSKFVDFNSHFCYLHLKNISNRLFPKHWPHCMMLLMPWIYP